MPEPDKAPPVEVGEGAFSRLDAIWRDHVYTMASAISVHTTLREGILSQVLAPGTRLAEEDLAARFGISRTPVREAILRLEAEGLVERSTGRTARITDISPREIVEIYELRAVVDGLAAELAATRIEPPALSSLEWTNQQMKEAGEVDDFASLASLNLRFHDEIGVASGNLFLRQTIRNVLDRVRRFPGTTLAHQGRWETVIEEHEAIIDALRAHDPERSFNEARHHMLVSREIRIAMLNDG